MLKTPLSKMTLYILLFIATIILPTVYHFGVAFMDISEDRNGHGIDGIGAALVAALIFKAMMHVAFGMYIIIVIKIIKSILYYKEVPNILIIIPFLPIIMTIALNSYKAFKFNEVQTSYTVDDYIAEVEEKKSQYSRWVDGEKAIKASEYIRFKIAEDSYWLSTRLCFNKNKRKAIIDEAIPILMQDLESENLCYCKYYDCRYHYYPTSIEYWEYQKESDTLIVKFAHEDKTDEFQIEYFNIAGTD